LRELKDEGMQEKPLQKTWQKKDNGWRRIFYYKNRFQHPGLPKSD